MQFHPRKMMVTETTTTATTSFNKDSCLLDCDSAFNPDGNCHGPCFAVCPSTCKFLFVDNDDNFYPLFPQPPPPPPTKFPVVPSLIPAGGHVDRRNLVVTSMSVAAAMVGVALLVGIFCMVLRIWRSRRRRRGDLSSMRRDPSAVFFATGDDFIAEDHGPVIDHPIWYIHTVGLEQSVIESIAVFRYKKEDKFIEGTDCSVCLSEFEEDESLRLLPKCSHAFHIPCIDTWLRSHKNCPLCRAPIVAPAAVNSGAVAAPAAAGLSENLNSGEESPVVDNSVPATVMITMEENQEEGEDGEVRIGSSSSSSSNEVELSDHSKRLAVLLRSHSRVASDVMEVGGREGAGELQGVRRSVSLDSSSAMAIYRAVENVEVEEEGEGKNVEARELKSCSKSRNGGKRGTSLSFRKFIKSGSLISLQKAPVSMKRSVSSSKASTSRHGGSILPL